MVSKVHEGLDNVQHLLAQAEEQGFLTFNQVEREFPQSDDEDIIAYKQELDDLFSILFEHGIEVYDSIKDAKEALAARDDGSDDDKDPRESDLLGISVNDPVSLYFTEMSRVPLLTYEQEVALAKAIEKGEEAEQKLQQNGHDPEEKAELEEQIQKGHEARRHLTKANTRLVVSIAKKYRGLGMPFLDLIQAGNLGLIKAVDKFDYTRGHKFGTYATWWIRQSITRSLSQQGRTIRIPVHLTDRIRKVYKTSQRLEQQLGRRPTPEEIAAEMSDLDPDETRWLLRVSRRPLSLEKPVDEEGDSEFGHFIEDESVPSPDTQTEEQLLSEDLQKMLTSLKPREARVLRLRFGLEGNRSHTLKEVGNKLGVTRERIRQIERRALRKLRHPRHSRILRDYLS